MALRQHHRWDKKKNDWVPYEKKTTERMPRSPMIVKDVEPYQSMLTGETIGGRRQHRDHLRAHRMIEVGNEYNKGLPVDKAPPAPEMSERARIERIKQAVAEVRDGRGRQTAGRVDDDLGDL